MKKGELRQIRESITEMRIMLQNHCTKIRWLRELVFGLYIAIIAAAIAILIKAVG